MTAFRDEKLRIKQNVGAAGLPQMRFCLVLNLFYAAVRATFIFLNY